MVTVPIRTDTTKLKVVSACSHHRPFRGASTGLTRLGDGLRHVRLTRNGSAQARVVRVSRVDTGARHNQSVQIMIGLVTCPRCAIRCTLGNQPGVIPARICERTVIGELQILDHGFAVHDFARFNCAPMGMAGGAFHAEVIGVADRLFAPLRFDCPLGDQQLGGAAGFLFEAHGDPGHLVQAGFEVSTGDQ